MKHPKHFESAGEIYTVTRVIGEGGAGRVFEVRNADGTLYALKALRPEHVSTDRRRRFKNELNFLRRNTHNHIVTVLDEGLADWGTARTPFYVMPLYAGTLRSQLRNKTIVAASALQAFSQILDGVEAAHLQGVIHRDLKPENILFDSTSGRYVVADFGVANFQDEELLTAVETRAADRLANFIYAAPEQRARGARVTVTADVFALGLVLHEMFTEDVIQGTDYRKISTVSPAHAYLDDIVERMVRQAADKRFAAIDEVKKELIARHNAFVAQQTLDAASQRVVPRFAPGAVAPVNLVGADWNAGLLTLQLDREPEVGWIQRFQQPTGSYRMVQGAAPRSFAFTGRRASVAAYSDSVQPIIDQFKIFLKMATSSYQEDLNRAAAERERSERATLEQERRAAAERARVLSTLKI